MNFKIKIIHVLAIFFILTMLISSVSALEFAKDYNLTSETFNKDEIWSGVGILIDVPSTSKFTLAEEYSGPIKNAEGKGNLSVFINHGEYADEVSMMILVESDNNDGTLGTEFIHDLMADYKKIDSEKGMTILELDNCSDILYDSESNGTDTNSSNSTDVNSSASVDLDLSDANSQDSDDLNLSDVNSSGIDYVGTDQMSYAEPETKAPQYAMACTTEDGAHAFILFGNELDLMKDMCEQFYFEM